MPQVAGPQDLATESVWADQSGPSQETLTPIPAASTAKPMIAFTVAHLALEGRLDLDHQVPLPGCRIEMSWRQALTHTGGVPFELHRDWWQPGPNPTDPEVREALRNTAPLPLAGSWHYSNGGYQAVAVGLAEQFGEPWPEMVRRHLWEPLGMSRTYVATEDTLHAASGASVVTTLTDLARFGAALAYTATEPGIKRLVDSMLEPYAVIDAATIQGLGIQIDLANGGRPLAWGTIEGSTSGLVAEPGLGAVAATIPEFAQGGTLRANANRLLDQQLETRRIEEWWFDGQPVRVTQTPEHTIARLADSPRLLFRAESAQIEMSSDSLKHGNITLCRRPEDSAC